MKSTLAIIVTAALLLGLGQAYGQIDVPKDSKMLLHVYGKGVQIYVCAPMAGDSTKYGWASAGARAVLYDDADYGKVAGKHYFDAGHHPVWESPDGGRVIGNKLRQKDAPEPGAVPWLLLQATSAPKAGPLSGTTFIQRVNTRGGKAPATGADALHKGATIEIEYSAEYLFYK